MPLRAQVLAVVSSKDQAEDERVSLDNQVAHSREAIQRLGCIEVAEPIRVWQSRDYYSLSELRADSPEYDELLRRAERGELDLIVGRDHSRVLGRTEALQVALRNHLQLCRVQLYFTNAPMQPVDPTALGRRGRAQIRNRYADAVAAVRDEEEVAELVRRRYEGMNGHAADGRWRMSEVPFGYRRQVLAEVEKRATDGSLKKRPVYGEMEPDAVRSGWVREWYQMYVDGSTYEEISDDYVAKTQKHSLKSSGRTRGAKLLQNPAHVGIMVYGGRRQDVVIEDGKERKVTKYVLTPDRKAELAEALIKGVDARTEEEKEAGVIVAWGQWEPIVPADLWLAVQRERRTRGPSPTSSYGNPGRKQAILPLSGLLKCDYCGHNLAIVGYHTTLNRDGPELRHPRYGCGQNRLYGSGTCAARWTRVEHRLRAELLETLAAFAEGDLLERALSRPLQSSVPASSKEAERLQREMRKAELAIQQWDSAFEAGALKLAEWMEKKAPHEAALVAVRAKLRTLEHTQVRASADAGRADRLKSLIAQLPEVEDDPMALKKLLKQILERVMVRDRRIVSVEFK